MRLFDDDKIGVYLDDIGHRVEQTKDKKELKMIDLTLRVQPFTPELATSLDPDVRALLFNLGDAEPKKKIKSLEFKLQVPNQRLEVFMLPELDEPTLVLHDVEITGVRARTEKSVDGYGLVFYASWGPVGRDEIEACIAWHTQQRFITCTPQEPALDFEGQTPTEDAPEPARHIGRRIKKSPIEPGDDLGHGRHAEH